MSEHSEEYLAYLKSDRWKATREWALERAGKKCERCQSARRLEVHHLRYDNLGSERPADLEVLCRPCHKSEHGKPAGYPPRKFRADASRHERVLLKLLADAVEPLDQLNEACARIDADAFTDWRLAWMFTYWASNPDQVGIIPPQNEVTDPSGKPMGPEVAEAWRSVESEELPDTNLDLLWADTLALLADRAVQRRVSRLESMLRKAGDPEHERRLRSELRDLRESRRGRWNVVRRGT